MNSKILIALGVAAALAAGCAKPVTTTAQPPNGEKTGDTYALGPCAKIGAPAPTGEAYIVTLDKTFDIKNPTAGHSGHKQGTHPGKHKHKTALDVVTLINGPQSGQIQIQLTPDSGLAFMDIDRALLGATANSASVFCDAKIGVVNGNSTLSFTYFPVGSDTSAAVNIGLLAGPSEFPVIIDPWEDNNGVVSIKGRSSDNN